MKIGKMDKRIQLQKQEKVSDGQGGYTTQWVTQAIVWAEFRKPSLQTAEATGTIVSELMREILIRFRADVRKGWRVLYGVKTFSVEHTYDYGREATVMVCKEVVK